MNSDMSTNDDNIKKERIRTSIAVNERKPLFPGKSCFPLSPDQKIKRDKRGFPIETKHD